MATFPLQWTPAATPTSVSQDVQYALDTASSYITQANVGPTVNQYTLTGLADNFIYKFRILNNCSFGGPIPSVPFRSVILTCPVVALTPSYDHIDYVFNHLGGSVTRYLLELLNSTGGGVISTVDITSPSSTMSGSFVSLTPNTTYQLRVTVFATADFSKVCPNQPVTTNNPPVCNAPTNVTATIG